MYNQFRDMERKSVIGECKINVLMLIDRYQINGGASRAVKGHMHNWRDCGKGEAYIYTTSNSIVEDEIRTDVFFDTRDLLEIIEEKDINVIHYFKSSRSLIKSSLLKKARKAVSKSHRYIPILTTVCQRPSYNNTILTTKDIKLSDHLVFIDNSAYNDALYNFIPEDRKTRIYFGSTAGTIQQMKEFAERKQKTEKFIFGRGSTLNKCPKDILDVFDRINVPSKQFTIAGVHYDSWLGQLAEGRDDVKIEPPTSYLRWLEICSTFDVFLYYLPDDVHSSLDGTLGCAMLMEIPPIVYGGDAPKERIIHGENGFIASTKDDIVHYAELLYRDVELREKMGKTARTTMIKMFSSERTVSEYSEIYQMLLRGKREPISVPFSDVVHIFKKQYARTFWIRFYHSILEKLSRY